MQYTTQKPHGSNHQGSMKNSNTKQITTNRTSKRPKKTKRPIKSQLLTLPLSTHSTSTSFSTTLLPIKPIILSQSVHMVARRYWFWSKKTSNDGENDVQSKNTPKKKKRSPTGRYNDAQLELIDPTPDQRLEAQRLLEVEQEYQEAVVEAHAKGTAKLEQQLEQQNQRLQNLIKMRDIQKENNKNKISDKMYQPQAIIDLKRGIAEAKKAESGVGAIPELIGHNRGRDINDFTPEMVIKMRTKEESDYQHLKGMLDGLGIQNVHAIDPHEKNNTSISGGDPFNSAPAHTQKIIDRAAQRVMEKFDVPRAFAEGSKEQVEFHQKYVKRMAFFEESVMEYSNLFTTTQPTLETVVQLSDCLGNLLPQGGKGASDQGSSSSSSSSEQQTTKSKTNNSKHPFTPNPDPNKAPQQEPSQATTHFDLRKNRKKSMFNRFFGRQGEEEAQQQQQQQQQQSSPSSQNESNSNTTQPNLYGEIDVSSVPTFTKDMGQTSLLGQTTTVVSQALAKHTKGLGINDIHKNTQTNKIKVLLALNSHIARIQQQQEQLDDYIKEKKQRFDHDFHAGKTSDQDQQQLVVHLKKLQVMHDVTHYTQNHHYVLMNVINSGLTTTNIKIIYLSLAYISQLLLTPHTNLFRDETLTSRASDNDRRRPSSRFQSLFHGTISSQLNQNDPMNPNNILNNPSIINSHGGINHNRTLNGDELSVRLLDDGSTLGLNNQNDTVMMIDYVDESGLHEILNGIILITTHLLSVYPSRLKLQENNKSSRFEVLESLSTKRTPQQQDSTDFPVFDDELTHVGMTGEDTYTEMMRLKRELRELELTTQASAKRQKKHPGLDDNDNNNGNQPEELGISPEETIQRIRLNHLKQEQLRLLEEHHKQKVARVEMVKEKYTCMDESTMQSDDPFNQDDQYRLIERSIESIVMIHHGLSTSLRLLSQIGSANDIFYRKVMEFPQITTLCDRIGEANNDLSSMLRHFEAEITTTLIPKPANIDIYNNSAHPAHASQRVYYEHLKAVHHQLQDNFYQFYDVWQTQSDLKLHVAWSTYALTYQPLADLPSVFAASRIHSTVFRNFQRAYIEYSDLHSFLDTQEPEGRDANNIINKKHHQLDQSELDRYNTIENNLIQTMMLSIGTFLNLYSWLDRYDSFSNSSSTMVHFYEIPATIDIVHKLIDDNASFDNSLTYLQFLHVLSTINNNSKFTFQSTHTPNALSQPQNTPKIYQDKTREVVTRGVQTGLIDIPRLLKNPRLFDVGLDFGSIPTSSQQYLDDEDNLNKNGNNFSSLGTNNSLSNNSYTISSKQVSLPQYRNRALELLYHLGVNTYRNSTTSPYEKIRILTTTRPIVNSSSQPSRSSTEVTSTSQPPATTTALVPPTFVHHLHTNFNTVAVLNKVYFNRLVMAICESLSTDKRTPPNFKHAIASLLNRASNSYSPQHFKPPSSHLKLSSQTQLTTLLDHFSNRLAYENALQRELHHLDSTVIKSNVSKSFLPAMKLPHFTDLFFFLLSTLNPDQELTGISSNGRFVPASSQLAGNNKASQPYLPLLTNTAKRSLPSSHPLMLKKNYWEDIHNNTPSYTHLDPNIAHFLFENDQLALFSNTFRLIQFEAGTILWNETMAVLPGILGDLERISMYKLARFASKNPNVAQQLNRTREISLLKLTGDYVPDIVRADIEKRVATEDQSKKSATNNATNTSTASEKNEVFEQPNATDSSTKDGEIQLPTLKYPDQDSQATSSTTSLPSDSTTSPAHDTNKEQGEESKSSRTKLRMALDDVNEFDNIKFGTLAQFQEYFRDVNLISHQTPSESPVNGQQTIPSQQEISQRAQRDLVIEYEKAILALSIDSQQGPQQSSPQSTSSKDSTSSNTSSDHSNNYSSLTLPLSLYGMASKLHSTAMQSIQHTAQCNQNRNNWSIIFDHDDLGLAMVDYLTSEVQSDHRYAQELMRAERDQRRKEMKQGSQPHDIYSTLPLDEEIPSVGFDEVKNVLMPVLCDAYDTTMIHKFHYLIDGPMYFTASTPRPNNRDIQRLTAWREPKNAFKPEFESGEYSSVLKQLLNVVEIELFTMAMDQKEISKGNNTDNVNPRDTIAYRYLIKTRDLLLQVQSLSYFDKYEGKMPSRLPFFSRFHYEQHHTLPFLYRLQDRENGVFMDDSAFSSATTRGRGDDDDDDDNNDENLPSKLRQKKKLQQSQQKYKSHIEKANRGDSPEDDENRQRLQAALYQTSSGEDDDVTPEHYEIRQYKRNVRQTALDELKQIDHDKRATKKPYSQTQRFGDRPRRFVNDSNVNLFDNDDDGNADNGEIDSSRDGHYGQSYTTPHVDQSTELRIISLASPYEQYCMLENGQFVVNSNYVPVSSHQFYQQQQTAQTHRMAHLKSQRTDQYLEKQNQSSPSNKDQSTIHHSPTIILKNVDGVDQVEVNPNDYNLGHDEEFSVVFDPKSPNYGTKIPDLRNIPRDDDVWGGGSPQNKDPSNPHVNDTNDDPTEAVSSNRLDQSFLDMNVNLTHSQHTQDQLIYYYHSMNQQQWYNLSQLDSLLPKDSSLIDDYDGLIIPPRALSHHVPITAVSKFTQMDEKQLGLGRLKINSPVSSSNNFTEGGDVNLYDDNNQQVYEYNRSTQRLPITIDQYDDDYHLVDDIPPVLDSFHVIEFQRALRREFPIGEGQSLSIQPSGIGGIGQSFDSSLGDQNLIYKASQQRVQSNARDDFSFVRPNLDIDNMNNDPNLSLEDQYDSQTTTKASHDGTPYGPFDDAALENLQQTLHNLSPQNAYQESSSPSQQQSQPPVPSQPIKHPSGSQFHFDTMDSDDHHDDHHYPSPSNQKPKPTNKPVPHEPPSSHHTIDNINLNSQDLPLSGDGEEQQPIKIKPTEQSTQSSFFDHYLEQKYAHLGIKHPEPSAFHSTPQYHPGGITSDQYANGNGLSSGGAGASIQPPGIGMIHNGYNTPAPLPDLEPQLSPVTLLKPVESKFPNRPNRF